MLGRSLHNTIRGTCSHGRTQRSKSELSQAHILCMPKYVLSVVHSGEVKTKENLDVICSHLKSKEELGNCSHDTSNMS